MNSKLFYKVMSHFYDLIDVIYFRDSGNNPRKVVFESIEDYDCVLDVCTGTATNALNIAISKPSSKVIGIDLSKDMLQIGQGKRKKADITNLK